MHPQTTGQGQIVNEVTGLYPVRVFSVVTPTTIEEVQEAIIRSSGPLSVGGGRFSMGGQTASPDCLQIDMRQMNQVVRFSPMEKTIRVQAGIRWCDLQRFLDPHDLSVSIMQTYANFTVGGSLGVNVHGRYIGQGPLILSVRAIGIVLANGEYVEATPEQNAEIFYGAIGGYGGLGVVVEAELSLAANDRVERTNVKIATSEYLEYFRQKVRDSADAIFHNGDLYPPHYGKVRAVTWSRTDRGVTEPNRLQPIRKHFLLEKYFFWAFTETPFGTWRREHMVDPLLFRKKIVHWRNYEAGYDVAELEPYSRKNSTYVLQEYFVPVDRLEAFVASAGEVLRRYRVNVVNISIRHALPDPGSMLAWARQEVFAFVLYYKQRTRDSARNRVAIWTRELVQRAIDLDGAYYLPYQVHATEAQFHQAYPGAAEFFALKKQLDPEYRFRNVLWDAYYPESPIRMQSEAPDSRHPDSEFKRVFARQRWHDGFYLFLQNVFSLRPEDRFHALIREGIEAHDTDESIYRFIQEGLKDIDSPLGALTHALPALAKQKAVLHEQTLALLGDERSIDGYLEIGTIGRYYSSLKKAVKFGGPLYMMNDVAPTNSPVDMIDRGQIAAVGEFLPLGDYEPLDAHGVAPGSLDLVTCYIGLHHCPLEGLDDFVRSIVTALRPGGRFILRDHDCSSDEMVEFVSLVHTVFNAGTGVSWADNAAEFRAFRPVNEWIELLSRFSLVHEGARIAQDNDPTDNLLLAFRKSS